MSPHGSFSQWTIADDEVDTACLIKSLSAGESRSGFECLHPISILEDVSSRRQRDVRRLLFTNDLDGPSVVVTCVRSQALRSLITSESLLLMSV